MSEPRYTLLWDIAARRPACALLQALARADTYFLQEIWPPVTWLEQPTATMQCVTGTRAEWERVAQREMA